MTQPVQFQPRTSGLATQATQVEQQRVTAEVQAAVVIAQQCPRDRERARSEMQQACSRLAIAERAFYSVPRKGSRPIEGATVHLARELVRCWGNITYGVVELRRDDDAGMSEMQAFAWDLQTNVRSTRTFQVPHERMAGGRRTRLNDHAEILNNNNSFAARAVRECIWSVLPDDFRAEAEAACRHTLQHGEGVPLEERVAKAVGAFAGMDVTEAQLAEYVGRPRAQWEAGDIGRLNTAYTTIQRGEATAEDLFPVAPVTVGEITAQAGRSETA